MLKQSHPSPSFWMILLETVSLRTRKDIIFTYISFYFFSSDKLTTYDRHAPSPDPYLHIKFYERTPEQQAALGYLSNSSQTGQPERDHPPSAAAIPHGAIGAAAGHRAIAQSNSTDISDNLFRYTAPEEVTSDHLKN